MKKAILLLSVVFSFPAISQTPLTIHGGGDAIETFQEDNYGLIGIGTQNFEAELKVRGVRVGIGPSNYKAIVLVDNGYGNLEFHDQHFEGYAETSFRVQRSSDDHPSEHGQAEPQVDFIVKGNGKTGVGFAVPTALLHVCGAIDENTVRNTFNLFQVDVNDEKKAPIFIINRNRRVGINTVSPENTLDVNGDARFTDNVSVEGNLRMNKQDIYFREGNDPYHGIGWYGQGKPFDNQQPDGPVLYGFSGGALGTRQFPGSGNSTPTEKFALQWDANGKVKIGNVSTPGNYKLYVEGGVLSEHFKCAVHNSADWSDYVFSDCYNLMPLERVDSFINQHHHLPNVPSANEVVESGVDMVKMDAILLQKIEELTLYVLLLKEEIRALKSQKQ